MTQAIADPSDRKRWSANLQAEIDGELVYRAMSANPGEPRLALLYDEMADAEARHAALWRERLSQSGPVPAIEPSWRARTLAFHARRFCDGLVAPTIASQERDGRTM
jgi:rubrerythrin